MRIPGSLLAAACAALCLAAPVLAQGADDAVVQLRDADVWVEEGALGGADAEELERAVAGEQESVAFFKAVVLGDAPRDGSARDVAADVLAGLGGGGRVVVYAPGEIGVASDVDALSDVALAESAASRATSFAESVRAAGDALAGDGGAGPILPGPSGFEDEEAPAGGSPQVVPSFGGGGLVLLVLLLMGAFFLVPTLRRGRRQDEEAAERETELVGEGERRVREAVEQAGNLIIDLSHRIDVPDVPAGATAAYRAGSTGFIEVHEELEHADTRAELEEIYPRIVEVVWQLRTARALLDGEQPPERPEPEPLFPRRELEPYEPLSYSGLGASPWFGGAAMTALSILGAQGVVWTSHRPAMEEDAFEELFELAGFSVDERGTRRRHTTWRY